MKKANLMQLLDQLEALVEDSPRVPLTGKSLVSIDDVYDIVDQLRISLPEEVKRAEWVAKEKERLLEESKNEAQNMIEQAKDYIQKLIDESEIMRQAKEQAIEVLDSAKEQAKGVLDSAKNDANDMAQGAASYAQEVFIRLEDELEKTLKTIRRGQEVLSKKQDR
jgi:F0F1-type ATP synthase membrane subunit b/b'